jgi:hypothetical protein
MMRPQAWESVERDLARLLGLAGEPAEVVRGGLRGMVPEYRRTEGG